jgi:pSer/pThr/pTyr-binding forkhead associated (FHA) protein
MTDPGVRLEIIAGQAIGTSIEVQDELLIGRQADDAGRLAEDPELSRTHARVGLAPDGTYTIEDLGSTNGTFVNGTRINGPRILLVEDTIELGGTTAVVREVRSPSPEVVAEVASAVREFTMPAGLDAIPPLDDALGATPATGSATGLPQLPETEVQPAAPPPPLGLRLEVDFAAGEARVLLDEGGDVIRLRHEDGAWRLAAAAAPDDEAAGSAPGQQRDEEQRQ